MKHMIIVPVHNAPEYTKQTLQTLLKVTNTNSNLICVIDDYSRGPTQKLLELFKQRHPQIRLFRTKKNCGKPASVNAIIKKFPNLDYYTIIDNDVVIKSQDWVNTLMKCHKLFKNQAILGAFTSEKGYAMSKSGYNFYDPYPFVNLAGRFFSIPKQIFRQLGYFYDFGFRHEDSEYCKRAALAGFRWYYIREIKARTFRRKLDKDRRLLLQKDTEEKQNNNPKRMQFLMRTHQIYYLPRRFVSLTEIT